MVYRFTLLPHEKATTGRIYTVESMAEFAKIVAHARDKRPLFENTGTDNKYGPAFMAPCLDGIRQNPQARNWIALDVDGPHEIDPETEKPVKIVETSSDGQTKTKTAPSIGIKDAVLDKLRDELKQYKGFIYPTHSDKPNARKCRVVLGLDNELEAAQWEAVVKTFTHQLAERVPELRAHEGFSESIDPASARYEQIMFTTPKGKADQVELLGGAALRSANLLTTNNYSQKRRKKEVKNTASPADFEPIDIVLQKLMEEGYHIRELRRGVHAIRCPLGDHDQDNETSTVYFEPGSVGEDGKVYRYGSFKCLHAKCAHYKSGDFYRALGLNYENECRKIDKEPNDFKANGIRYLTSGGTVSISRWNSRDGGSWTPPIACFSEIEILGEARDWNNENWGRLIEFYDRDGRKHEKFLLNSELTGKGDDVREELTQEGFELMNTGNGISKILCDYIYQRPLKADPDNPEKERQRIRITTSAGWLGEVFVTPDKIYGPAGEKIYYSQEKKHQANYEIKGTLEDWRGSVSYLAQYSNNLTLAICTAFAAPLIRITSMAEQISSGFHFYGLQGTGKTSIIKAAASVYGKPVEGESDGGRSDGRIVQWTATANRAEYIAAAYNDNLLCIDEATAISAKEIEAMCYRLGNGKLKARLNKDLMASSAETWKIMILSTGETSIEKAGEREKYDIRAGALARLISIRAQSENGDAYGIFESLPNDLNREQAYSELINGYTENYGTAGDAWLTFITSSRAEITQKIRDYFKEFTDPIAKELGYQQMRELRRFALCAAAGEIASEAGITGWKKGHAIKAISKAAIRSFGKDSMRTKEMKKFLSRLISDAQNLKNFAPLGDDNGAAKICGYRNFDAKGYETPFDPKADRLDLSEHEEEDKELRLFLFDEYFNSIIGGLEPKAALDELIALGLLVQNDKDSRRKWRYKAKIRVGKILLRHYTIRYEKLVEHSEEGTLI